LIDFPGQTGRLGRGDRLDQARIVIPRREVFNASAETRQPDTHELFIFVQSSPTSSGSLSPHSIAQKRVLLQRGPVSGSN
jgi:hypothetical protein